MSRRLQTINGDTVLEITDTAPVKTRLSENDLLRRKTYLEEAITKFQTELEDVNGKLAQINAEKAPK